MSDKSKLSGGWSILDAPRSVWGKLKALWTGARKNASPSVRKFVEKHGTEPIAQMKVVRKPIQSTIEKIANWLSLGTFERNKKELNYDKMFHLYLVIKMENGMVIRMDKNHVVEVGRADWYCGSGATCDPPEQEEVKGAKGKTVALLLNHGENLVGKDQYWVYNPVNANCQLFVKWTLEGSNLLTDHLEKFVVQDVGKVLKKLDYLGTVATKVTNIAGTADHVIYGKGMIQGIQNHHMIFNPFTLEKQLIPIN